MEGFFAYAERPGQSIQLIESPNFENDERFYTMHVLHILPTEQGLDGPYFY